MLCDGLSKLREADGIELAVSLPLPAAGRSLKDASTGHVGIGGQELGQEDTMSPLGQEVAKARGVEDGKRAPGAEPLFHERGALHVSGHPVHEHPENQKG
jgi:hypothetical protein